MLDKVPGPDVDEFTNSRQVRAALAGRSPAAPSLLAVQHPHRTPDSLAAGKQLHEVLPQAREALLRLQRQFYREVTDVVAAYHVDGPDGTALGVLCIADPAEVGADGVASVRRSEETYPDVVAERAAVLTGLRCLTSAALLVPVLGGSELTAAVSAVIDTSGPAAVTTVDSSGNRHHLWLVGPGPNQQYLLAAAGKHPLLVADGNHRVAAAEASGLGGMLALVTGGPALRVGPINRVLTGTGHTLDDLVSAWRGLGLDVQSVPELSAAYPRPGTVVARNGNTCVLVRLPAPAVGEPLPRIDHGAVENVLIAEALGIDPAGPHLLAVPQTRGLDPAVVPAGVELVIAAVPVSDVLAVHAAGRRMPRKSTYFTPKPRSGLLLAGLGD